jgi:hypothetical protein
LLETIHGRLSGTKTSPPTIRYDGAQLGEDVLTGIRLSSGLSGICTTCRTPRRMIVTVHTWSVVFDEMRYWNSIRSSRLSATVWSEPIVTPSISSTTSS